MANRSLRRSYGGDASNSNGISTAVGSEPGSESESVDGIADANQELDGTGNEREPDTIGNSSSVGVVEIDPEQLGDYIAGNGAGAESDSGTRKRRGRKPGTKNGRKKAEASVKPFLLMAHQWAAVLLKTPELMIDETEAQSLSDAYDVFCEHHEVPILSPKRMSEINLIAAMALVYGPRFVAVRNRTKDEKKIKHAKNVTPFATGTVSN
jgi:hypothetical protein